MNPIGRSERIQHLDAVLPPAPDMYVNPELASSQRLFKEDETAAFHYVAAQDGPGDPRLYDFERWLHNAPEAQRLLATDAMAAELLPVYGQAIREERQEVEMRLERLRPQFGRRLDDLAARGHIPAVLAERFRSDPKATHMQLAIADSSHAADAAAFYMPGVHTIYFRPWSSNQALAKSYAHESFHALSGTTLGRRGKAIYASRNGLGANVVGSEGYVNDNKPKHRALNEGVTEYLTNLAVYGRPGAVSPDRRVGKDTGHYKVEREIVQIIADRIGIDTILDAYAEDYDPARPDLSHLRVFMGQVRRAFGPGFLQKLDRLDQTEGPERALAFVKAAEYTAARHDEKQGRERKLGRFTHPFKKT